MIAAKYDKKVRKVLRDEDTLRTLVLTKKEARLQVRHRWLGLVSCASLHANRRPLSCSFLPSVYIYRYVVCPTRSCCVLFRAVFSDDWSKWWPPTHVTVFGHVSEAEFAWHYSMCRISYVDSPVPTTVDFSYVHTHTRTQHTHSYRLSMHTRAWRASNIILNQPCMCR